MPIANWGMANGGGFQNALAMGMQMGAQVRQAQDQRDYRNALAQFDPSNPDTLKPIMAVRPEVGIQLRGQIEQRQAAEAAAQQQGAERRLGQMPQVMKLLETATDEASYQRNIGFARQMGLDTSQLPPNFDPEWRDQNLKLMRAISTPEGQEVMSTAGKQAFDEGFRPGTPEFQARAKEIWQQSGAIPYTDESGATRLYVPGRGVPTQQPIAEGTVIANDAGEQMILRNGRWEPFKGGTGSNVGGNFR